MSDPSQIVRELAIAGLPILLAITFHEGAHGLAADRLGDPTPRLNGRLTLNPFAHLDPLGTLVFLLTRTIGWAKPVPIDARRFRSPRRDLLLVSLAGPAANFALALAMAFAFRALAGLPHHGFWGERVLTPLALMAYAGVRINLGLGLFNLVPVPPLDGSRILACVLPGAAARAFGSLERYGFVILAVLIATGGLEATLYPVLRGAFRVLVGSG